MGNNSVPKFILSLSRFPVYRGSVLDRFYCICIYMYKNTHIRTYIYILLYIYIRAHTYTHIYIYTHTHTHTCTDIHNLHAHVHTNIQFQHFITDKTQSQVTCLIFRECIKQTRAKYVTFRIFPFRNCGLYLD